MTIAPSGIISIVQGPTIVSGGASVAYGSNVTAGNLLVVVMAQGGNGSSLQSITDTIGNTYLQATASHVSAGSTSTGIVYAVTIAGGANTVSFTSASTFAAVYEISGATTLDGVATVINNATTTTNWSSGTPNSVGGVNEFAAGVAFFNGGVTITNNSPYTMVVDSGEFGYFNLITTGPCLVGIYGTLAASGVKANCQVATFNTGIVPAPKQRLRPLAV